MLAERDPNLVEAAVVSGHGLPKRDYVLIPLLGVLTILAMFVVSEVGTRAFWPVVSSDECIVKDAVQGDHAKSNCTEEAKTAEGVLVTYRYNECGYRTNVSCGTKAPGTIRMVLLGSSISQGLHIPFDETFAARTVRDLSRVSGRHVELENLGLENRSPLYCYRKLNEAMTLDPDFVVYAVTPFDVELQMDAAQLANRDKPDVALSKPAAQSHAGRMQRVNVLMRQSRAVIVAQHFFFSNPETYLQVYLKYGDKADYLRQPLSSAWQRRFSDIGVLIEEMSLRLRQRQIPLFLLAVPTQAEAILINTPQRPAHTDPFTFGREIQRIAVKAAAEYVDVLSEFEHVPHIERFFYPVDGHINSDGQAFLSRALVRRCLQRAAVFQAR